MRHVIYKQILLLGVCLAAAACGGSSTGTGSAVAGSYTATLFTTTGTSGQRYELIAGSTLQINLAANGTTSGHLHLAASAGSPAFDADMAGTWTLNGTTVQFSQSADTFVRNMAFTWGPDPYGLATLSGDSVFSGNRVQVVLTRA